MLAYLEWEDEQLTRVLNENGCSNWTVCPECGMDDFQHIPKCAVQAELRA